MERIVVWYLRMSLIYFVAGAFLGLVMIIWPGESGYYMTTHVHFNLLGFMSMMIYGVGYHILPKFSGRHVYSPVMVRVQFWLANAGLIGMAASWPFVAGDTFTSLFNPLIVVSASISFVAISIFAVNILKTIKPA
jgi:cytochrome c oxidase cbb3-type subunit 1